MSGQGSRGADVPFTTAGAGFMDKKFTTIDFTPLVDMIDLLSVQVKSKLATIRSKRSSMTIADMFDMQMGMNKLSQVSEMSTAIVSAVQQSLSRIAQGIKG